LLIFRHGVKRPGYLDLCPFDLYMGSQLTRVMDFLPVYFQLAIPFHSWLRVRHGTDRKTDRQRTSTLNTPPWGAS